MSDDRVRPTKIVDVVQTGIIRPDDMLLVFEGEDGHHYPLQVARDVAFKTIEALRQTAAKLPQPPGHRTSAIVYRLVGCSSMLTTTPEMGLVLKTEEGLEIAVRLDQAALDALLSAIRDAGTSSTSDGGHH